MSTRTRLPGLAALLAACAMLGAGSAAVAQEGAEIAEQFKCPTCHVTRLKEVKKPTGPLLVDAKAAGHEAYGQQEPASTQRMCLSCHDGFVRDSRFAWSEGHMTHPVGVKPPGSMKLPMVGESTLFPLNKDGEVYCGTCHSAHLGEGAAAAAPDFARVSPENGQLCQNCHADKATVAGTPHARVKKTGQPPDFDKAGICSRCHAPHDNAGVLMWAKTTGKGNTPVVTLCRSCHKDDPEHGEHPADVLARSQAVCEPLRGKPGKEMPVFDTRARHAARGAIGCATCHDPHRREAEGLAAGVPGYFLRLSDTADFMCADCHGPSALYRYRYLHAENRRLEAGAGVTVSVDARIRLNLGGRRRHRFARAGFHLLSLMVTGGLVTAALGAMPLVLRPSWQRRNQESEATVAGSRDLAARPVRCCGPWAERGWRTQSGDFSTWSRTEGPLGNRSVPGPSLYRSGQPRGLLTVRNLHRINARRGCSSMVEL